MSQAPVEAHKKPVVKYRVELQKRIQINKSYKEARNRAIAIRILQFGLFGQKRFQNLYLSCSLNCFYWGLQIANFLHQRVANLAMIIKFEEVHVIEYFDVANQDGKTYVEKKYTKMLIKLTKNPNEQDKQQVGYNAGLESKDIKNQIKELPPKRQFNRQNKQQNRKGKRNNREDRGNKGDRGDRRDREDRRDKGDRRTRQENGERKAKYDQYDDRRIDRRDRYNEADRRYYKNNNSKGYDRNEQKPRNEYRKKYNDDDKYYDSRKEDRRQYKQTKQEKLRRQDKQKRQDKQRKQRQESRNTRYQERGQKKTRGTGNQNRGNSRYPENPKGQDRGDRRPRYGNRDQSDDD